MQTTTLVIAFSALSTVASVANAQLAPPPNNLGSYANYIMAAVEPTTDTNCGSSANVMHNVAVTMEVTEPIVVASSTCSPTGFSLQLNANAPTSITGKSQGAWQQYCLNVGENSGSTNFDSHTQIWSLVKGNGFSPSDSTIGSISTAAPTIPAGYTLTWYLQTDSKGNVTQVTYGVYDASGKELGSPVTVSVPAATIAPISSFELDLVGYGNGCEATFQSGAGYIYYSADNVFTPQSQIPSCAISTVTGEQSANSDYGLMSDVYDTEQVQEFYISRYQWQKVAPLAATGGSASSTILGDSTFPLTLNTGDANAVTLAPGNFRNLSWLGSTADSSGENALENSCSYSSGPGTQCNAETGNYYWGLAWGTGGSNLFQWSREGGVWINNVDTGWGPNGAGGVYTSVAPVTQENMFLTRYNDTSCWGSTPSGPCIYSAAQGSTPAKWHNFGGSQVAVDSRQITTDLFTIDWESGTVYEITTGSSPKATALTTNICGTNANDLGVPATTLIADQIAVKGGVVFAIQDNDGQGGMVFEYTPGDTNACFDGTDGWTQVGNRSNFLSIATDLVAGQSGGTYGDGCAVWATDSNNNAWCACYGSGTCTAPFPVQ